MSMRDAGLRCGSPCLMLRLSFGSRGRHLTWHTHWGQLGCSPTPQKGGWQAPPRSRLYPAPALAPSSLSLPTFAPSPLPWPRPLCVHAWDWCPGCSPGRHCLTRCPHGHWVDIAQRPPPHPLLRKRPICLAWNLGWGVDVRFGPKLGAQSPALREQRPVHAIIFALELCLFTTGSISQTEAYTLL